MRVSHKVRYQIRALCKWFSLPAGHDVRIDGDASSFPGPESTRGFLEVSGKDITGNKPRDVVQPKPRSCLGYDNSRLQTYIRLRIAICSIMEFTQSRGPRVYKTSHLASIADSVS